MFVCYWILLCIIVYQRVSLCIIVYHCVLSCVFVCVEEGEEANDCGGQETWQELRLLGANFSEEHKQERKF